MNAIEKNRTGRRALGRGLSALIPGHPSEEREVRETPEAPVAGRSSYFLAPIEDIHPSPEQPRKVFADAGLEELAASIRQEGIIQPLVVRERARPETGFWLIAGERRWRAAQRAGLHEVPVVIREANDARAFELALVENVQREDLNAIEEAEAYQHLADAFAYTQEQIAERVGKDRTTVTNALRLLKLPPVVRQMVQDGVLSMGHARALLGLDDAQAIEKTAHQVSTRGLSVRAAEELVRREKEGVRRSAAPGSKSTSVRDLEDRLTRALAVRVTVQDRGGGKGGKIEIRYGSLDELDTLLDRLLPARS
jgi:ParB family transcriptional regulator, chromosome partitioning protein